MSLYKENSVKYSGVMLLVCFFILFSVSYGEVSVTPKHIFFGSVKRTVPVFLINSGTESYEVSIELRYGHAATDDSGKITMSTDTVTVDGHSAMKWLKPYPQRFYLPGGESQTIRVVAYPPAGLADGEYWARINITLKPIKAIERKAKGLTTSGGIVFSQTIGLPVYFRQGKVSTGIQLTNFSVAAENKNIVCSMNLEPSGNAAFLGFYSLRLFDQNGKELATVSSNVSIFEKSFIKRTFDRTHLPAGTYQVKFDISSSKRTDIDKKLILEAVPVRASASVIVP